MSVRTWNEVLGEYWRKSGKWLKRNSVVRVSRKWPRGIVDGPEWKRDQFLPRSVLSRLITNLARDASWSSYENSSMCCIYWPDRAPRRISNFARVARLQRLSLCSRFLSLYLSISICLSFPSSPVRAPLQRSFSLGNVLDISETVTPDRRRDSILLGPVCSGRLLGNNLTSVEQLANRSVDSPSL